MKKYIMMAAALAALTACKMELPTYGGSNGASFVTAEQQFSFVYSGEQATSELVWLDITLHGDIEAARTVALEQAPAVGNEKAAVAGKHFTAFNDPSMAQYYEIPAGATTARVPVKVLRDASLADDDYVLRVRIARNGSIEGGMAGKDEIAITISDKLVRPANWIDLAIIVNPFGNYGAVKHQWLIDNTDARWDYDYLLQLGFVDDSTTYPAFGTIMNSNANYDIGYLNFYAAKLAAKLAAQNAANGSPLMEADGKTEVKFAI